MVKQNLELGIIKNRIKEALRKKITQKTYCIFKMIKENFDQGENLDSGETTYGYAALQKKQFFAGSTKNEKILPFFNNAFLVVGANYYINPDYSPAQGVSMDIYYNGRLVFAVCADSAINITAYVPGDWEKELKQFGKNFNHWLNNEKKQKKEQTRKQQETDIKKRWGL